MLASTTDLPSLRPEQVLAALPEAPLMPLDPTGRFIQGVPFGLEEYLDWKRSFQTLQLIGGRRHGVPHRLRRALAAAGHRSKCSCIEIRPF